MVSQKSMVSLVHTADRKTGVEQSIKALNINPVKNKHVLIKPNFNTADATPGSTHNDTLAALVKEAWNMGAKTVSVGERSFPLTLEVMEKKGILPILKALEVKIINFDDLGEKDWVEFKPEISHWQNGFRIARPILESECLISTCCLKTHQFGGVFTLSLKLHVGVVPTRRHGFNYMQELHTSPHQRKMIAEINAPFSPDLIILDGVEAFVDGGPAEGKRAQGNVFLASTDRVAMDAVGVAVLKHLGSNDQIMAPGIFQQEQIARAAEIGLGATSPSQIQLLAASPSSAEYRDKIARILDKG
ncbi:MAG: DUF362 domain-containing protein [Proteobacteria bacterium]|nr:DUF362 domain-containing protein [Pseudomonadota bacterium]